MRDRHEKKLRRLYNPTPYELPPNATMGPVGGLESHNLTGLPSPPLLVGQARVRLRDGYLQAGGGRFTLPLPLQVGHTHRKAKTPPRVRWVGGRIIEVGTLLKKHPIPL